MLCIAGATYAFPYIFFSVSFSLQCFPRKVRQDKARAVRLRVIIPAQLVFVLTRPRPQRFAEVALAILGSDQETDLARGVGGDGGPGVFDDGEDFAHALL